MPITIKNETQLMGTESPDIIVLQCLSGRFRFFSFKGLFLLFLTLTFAMCENDKTADSTPISISMKAMVGLQYDVVRFKVKPGSKVKITLNNVSDMSHNLLITKPGARLDVVNSALKLAGKGPQMDYIPGIDEVLWSIPVISPGQSKSVTFTAPGQSGVYPYVCTYPGHGFVMYGAMYVTPDDTLPDIRNDLNIPESRRLVDTLEEKDGEQTQNKAMENPHPYALIPPYFYNVFLEGANPDVIAVHLPEELSYAWDAGSCRLQFAWKGGFLDMSDLWKGHFNASAKILGDIFYRDNTEYPFRLGVNSAIPNVEYKGYRLVERYPEFHYTLNGIDVYELIRPKADGFGLIRDFRIPHADRKFWFFENRQDDPIEYEFTAGRYKNKKLELSPAEAKAFTITMTSYYLAYKEEKE
jgi:azurin